MGCCIEKKIDEQKHDKSNKGVANVNLDKTNKLKKVTFEDNIYKLLSLCPKKNRDLKCDIEEDFGPNEKKDNIISEILLIDYIKFLILYEGTEFIYKRTEINVKHIKDSNSVYNTKVSKQFFKNFMVYGLSIFNEKKLIEKKNYSKKLEVCINKYLTNFEVLKIKLCQYTKSTNFSTFIMKKWYIFAYGFLYCKSDNNKSNKIKLLFELFQNNNLISETEYFKIFLFCLFCIPTYCLVSTALNFRYENIISNIPLEYGINILNCCEINMLSQLIHNVCNQLFFKKELNFEEFNAVFTNDQIKNEEYIALDWIFDSCKIRYKLQKLLIKQLT